MMMMGEPSSRPRAPPVRQTFSPRLSNGDGHDSKAPRSITQYTPFSRNTRISLALAPCALFLLDLGGIPVMLSLSLGLLLSYALDSFSLKTAAFFSLWVSLFVSLFSLLFSPTFLNLPFSLIVLAFALCAITVFILGVWASLQFRFLQLEHPSVVLSLETLIFACTPVVASSIWTWASVSALGMHHAPFFLSAFLCIFYWAFSLPRRSSFKKSPSLERFHGGQIPDETLILAPLESSIHTLTLLFFPLLFYLASHHRVAFSSVNSICDMLLLFFIPFLFQLYASMYGALWWITKDSIQLHGIRVWNGAVALVVVTVCLEIRVVFHSFAKYLHVPPPLSYLLVTLVMLGSSGGAGVYMVGMISDSFSSLAFSALSVMVSGAGAVVVGVPLLLLPVPVISGFYLARFLTKKSLPSYFIFVGLASLTVTWFVVHNYWSLNIWVAGMALKSFCKLIVASVVLALAVPGFALLPPKYRFSTELGLISHALVLCFIEKRFFSYSNISYFGFDDDVMYPSYMVITTTFLGLGLVRRLFLDNRIGPKAVWVLTCLYLSKLSMLFITSRSVLWISAILLLAISPPVLLYKDKSRSTSKMKPWQGFVHGGVVAISAWLCRETIFEALQWWMGRPPSDGLLLGFYILLTGLACIPIVALHFSHVQQAKRGLFVLVSVGLLFILMQPPIPLSLAFRSQLIKMAHQSADDITIYGYITSKPSWPSWLLITTVVLTLAAMTSIIPVKYIVELRAFYAIGVGTTFGIYICAEYFLQAPILHAMLVASIICASIFVVFTHFPSASSTRLLPWIFALLVTLFPVMYLLEGQLRVRNPLEGESEQEEYATLLAIGARTRLLGLFASIFMLIALEIKFELASLMREKALEKGGVLQNQATRVGGLAPKYRMVQQRRVVGPTPSFLTVKKLAAEGAWMPFIGNVSTLLCFTICLVLSIHLTGGSNRAIFLITPILLLLNQDSDFLIGFGDRQRYFPVVLAISGYLVLLALYRIWEEVWHGNAGWGLDIGGPGWFFAVKNAALLILTLPNHILFNRFMWDYAKQADSVLLLTLPLNLPSIIITDIITVKVLGLLGVIYSLVQYLVSRHIRIAGMKYI
ncbi:hypothetical protein AMTRI_Chr06g191580 [Amborella trichopoda]